jgi:diguanylate cyclase (GGDEF)-like protein
MFRRINQFLTGRSWRFILVVGWLLVMLVGILNYVTRRDFEVDIFYLLPIFIVTWYGNKQAGIATAIFATVVFAMIDRANRPFPLHLALTIWNAFVEFGFFLIVVILLSTVKRYAHQLEELATQDPLTGIANRRHFAQSARLEIRRCERQGSPFTVVYVDIDDFKVVNDTQGHNVGDALLCQVAVTIKKHTRDIDTVARLGGDEFAILLPSVDVEGAKQVIERICRSLLEAMTDKDWPVTFSIGVVAFSQPPASLDEMVERVDTVMYSVKRRGKNRIAFESWPMPEIISQ